MNVDVTNMGKVVITVATTGGLHGKEAHPELPEQPDEIIKAMKESYDAGATIAHIHVRDKQGVTSPDLAIYSEVVQGIKDLCPGMITQVGNGIGMRFLNGRNKPAIESTLDERMALLNIESRPDMLTVNAGTFHFQHKQSEVLFDNSKAWNTTFIKGCVERGIHNEFEVYDISHVVNILRLAERGVVTGPMHFSIVLGIDGGIPASPKHLMTMIDEIPDGASWQVVCVGKHQLPLSTMVLAMGGNIRVGTEDNIFYAPGELVKNNAQLVERAVRIAKELGRKVATADEARRLMGLHSSKATKRVMAHA